eukprot:TRINITY_DN17498_c0_g1_i1.p1 TRINITY_DN17498_c0_g1~~TRINITY_DN17498_c0_g1_i1.p1  ORF type:complete len:132 (-),score=26.11 TRINITY_DN17498_c0_g1_i1:94-489(-)
MALPITTFFVALAYNAILEAIVLLTICVSVPSHLTDEASFWDASIEGVLSSLGPLMVAIVAEYRFGFVDDSNPLDSDKGDQDSIDDNAESLQKALFWVTTVCWSLAAIAGISLTFSRKFKPIIRFTEDLVF